jgi:hypothetical protein
VKERKGFTMVDNRIFAITALTVHEKYLFTYLKSNTGTRFRPTLWTIAKCCGMSRTSVIKGLKSLERVNAVTVLSVKRDEEAARQFGPRKPNAYRVNNEKFWLPDLIREDRRRQTMGIQ